MKPKKVYSPHQVYVGAFLGGPPCAIYFIYKNFQVMERAKHALLTLALGSVLFLAVLGSIHMVPEDYPNLIIPIFYSGLAGSVVWYFQISKEDEAVNDQYGFISNWQVAKYSAISLLVTVILLLISAYVGHIVGIGEA